jgi:hypothetical protein
MKLVWLFVLLIDLAYSYGQNSIELSPPVTSIKRCILNGNHKKIGLEFRMNGSEIRYTINGKNPNETSKIYRDSIKVKKECKILARTFNKDFVPSKPVVIEVIKVDHNIDSLKVNVPHLKYSAKGAQTLKDLLLGDENYKDNYLGFEGEDALITVYLKKEQKIKEVNISVRIDQNAWIFGPRKIAVFDKNKKIIGSLDIINAASPKDSKNEIVKVKCNSQKLDQFTIVVYCLHVLPNWHAGKGHKAWLFIDEVWY